MVVKSKNKAAEKSEEKSDDGGGCGPRVAGLSAAGSGAGSRGCGGLRSVRLIWLVG